MAGKKHHLARFNFKRDLSERFKPIGVAFADLVEMNHQENKASINGCAAKGCKSSIASPTPIKRTGNPKFLLSAKITPPFAVPSSLVSTSPVTPADSRNC